MIDKIVVRETHEPPILGSPVTRRFTAMYHKEVSIDVMDDIPEDIERVVKDNVRAEVNFRVREDVFGTWAVGEIEFTKKESKILLDVLRRYGAEFTYTARTTREIAERMNSVDDLVNKLMTFERRFR